MEPSAASSRTASEAANEQPGQARRRARNFLSPTGVPAARAGQAAKPPEEDALLRAVAPGIIPEILVAAPGTRTFTLLAGRAAAEPAPLRTGASRSTRAEVPRTDRHDVPVTRRAEGVTAAGDDSNGAVRVRSSAARVLTQTAL
jgi:hypothetical protein